MQKTKKPVIIICSLIAMIIVGVTMLIYINYVQHSLWEDSVSDILEATSQESESFQLYLNKNLENLNNILKTMPNRDDSNKDVYLKKLAENNSSYNYINLDDNYYFNNNGKYPLTSSNINKINDFNSSGITKPYFNNETGVNVIATYTKINNELLIKETKVDYFVKQFSLSFYNDLGFSYIVNSDGDVLIRSSHKNSNRTMKNLYDIIDLEGNKQDVINSFKSSISNGQKGIALFNYHNNTNLFCYVPIDHTNNWYIISIIPNDAIMAQANKIIIFTIILSLVIICSIALILLLYHYNDKKQKDKILNLAYYDPLTHLYNYQKFKYEGEAKLKNLIDKWAIIYIDIDGFKTINDLSGYEFGDQILKELAKIIEKTISNAGIACHITADKFLIMHKYSNKDDLKLLCHKINHQFQFTLKENDFQKETYLNMGVCCYEDTKAVTNIDSMIDRSHLALKKALIDHDNYFVFYNYKMREKLIKEAEIEAKMVKALNNNEFVFYLQPKFNCQGKQLFGAEALVRWIDDNGQMIMPGDFIPLFERNGFIIKLDEYIFESVCKYLSNRIQLNLSIIPISINISRLHLFQNNFVDKYLEIKNKYAIPDKILELEITENILIDNLHATQKVITRLQRHGFICSIDDFGSGYSSLNSLKDLPFDIIKLDKLFLDNSYNIKKSQEIIKSIITMAKNINILTVAEGVETNEQLNFLQLAGCDIIQGYIFSKPISVEDFENIFKNLYNS
ncbi:MAG: EAL domain-containing protein [Thomasclavelia sp.]|uniref:bifunctional diguanylate cyclase/phosphodiesterase n=1 Tax=Thomasclavelia sp. TaxID=3025757 RepID=UPI00399F9A81